MNERIYNRVTPEKWQAIQQAAATYGLNIQRHVGHDNAFGVSFGWKFSEANERLKIEIKDAGFVGLDHALSFIDGIIIQA